MTAARLRAAKNEAIARQMLDEAPRVGQPLRASQLRERASLHLLLATLDLEYADRLTAEEDEEEPG